MLHPQQPCAPEPPAQMTASPEVHDNGVLGTQWSQTVCREVLGEGQGSGVAKASAKKIL